MDSVRFGRALGIGVREAAKAAAKAAEAAVAPGAGGSARSSVQERGRDAMQTARGLKEGGRRFGQAAMAPVAKAGGVLWHEVMGVLFGLFVLVAGGEVWRGRSELIHGRGRTHEWFAVAMVAGFGFFMVSSFLKARRRGRR